MAISSANTGLRAGVCTSTTRPTAPYTGQIIWETDTARLLVWNGSTWSLALTTGSYLTSSVSVAPNFFVYMSGANGSVVNDGTIQYNTALYDDTSSVSSGVFTVPSGQAGVYQFVCNANAYNIGSTGYARAVIVTTGSTSINFQGSQTPAQGGTDTFMTSTAIVKLAVGDTVFCRWKVPASGLYSSGITYNNFAGVRIR
jgi:hypothetical protein